MKEQYMKQVEKELRLPRKLKAEVLRDLSEIFASAKEHGETEQQVIDRLGTPQDYAASTAEQFGVHNATLIRRNVISIIVALVIAVVACEIYATTNSVKVPNNAIGQADAMTSIQVEGMIGIDATLIILVVGLIAAFFAIVQIVRTILSTRRKK